mmetsp:Transcript_18650/g.51150  ORF Transcript_18650/g.51150 Transcript_18650/m.51150 type:complete len:113 (-) Transcript_18650:454-792(-)
MFFPLQHQRPKVPMILEILQPLILSQRKVHLQHQPLTLIHLVQLLLNLHRPLTLIHLVLLLRSLHQQHHLSQPLTLIHLELLFNLNNILSMPFLLLHRPQYNPKEWAMISWE